MAEVFFEALTTQCQNLQVGLVEAHRASLSLAERLVCELRTENWLLKQKLQDLGGQILQAAEIDSEIQNLRKDPAIPDEAVSIRLPNIPAGHDESVFDGEVARIVAVKDAESGRLLSKESNVTDRSSASSPFKADRQQAQEVSPPTSFSSRHRHRGSGPILEGNKASRQSSAFMDNQVMKEIEKEVDRMALGEMTGSSSMRRFRSQKSVEFSDARRAESGSFRPCKQKSRELTDDEHADAGKKRKSLESVPSEKHCGDQSDAESVDNLDTLQPPQRANSFEGNQRRLSNLGGHYAAKFSGNQVSSFEKEGDDSDSSSESQARNRGRGSISSQHQAKSILKAKFQDVPKPEDEDVQVPKSGVLFELRSREVVSEVVEVCKIEDESDSDSSHEEGFCIAQALSALKASTQSYRLKGSLQGVKLNRGHSMSREFRESVIQDDIKLPVNPPWWKAAANLPTIEPNSRTNLIWESMQILLLSYDTVAIPLTAFDLPENASVSAMNWIIRMFWTIDIIISFNTGYRDSDGKLVSARFFIARRYLLTTFSFDIFVVGTDWVDAVIDSSFKASAALRSWRFLRMARLLRLKKAKELSKRFSMYIRSERLSLMSSIFQMLVLILVIVHLIACTWYAVSSMSVNAGYSSWITSNDSPTPELYLTCALFAISMLYGQQYLTPLNWIEYLYLFVILYLAFIGNVWLLGSITTAMTHLEIISTRRITMFKALDKYLTENNVPPELTVKVTRMAQKALREQQENVEESGIELLQMISEPLMFELHFSIYSPYLFISPFFRVFAKTQPSSIRNICHQAVSRLVFRQDDIIFNEMEKPRVAQAFFIDSGNLRYVTQQSWHLNPRPDGLELSGEKHWISEAALWVDDWTHVGTLRAETDCRLLAVNAKEFQAIVAMAGENLVRVYAELLIDHLNGAEKGTLTDISEYTLELGRLMNRTYGEAWMEFKPEYQRKIEIQEEHSIFGGRTSMLQGVHRPSLLKVDAQDRSSFLWAIARMTSVTPRTSDGTSNRHEVQHLGVIDEREVQNLGGIDEVQELPRQGS